jgi:hypothetical protein
MYQRFGLSNHEAGLRDVTFVSKSCEQAQPPLVSIFTQFCDRRSDALSMPANFSSDGKSARIGDFNTRPSWLTGIHPP